LTAALLARGDEVVGIDSLSTYYSVRAKRANLAELKSPRFTFVHGSLNELDLAAIVRDGIDAIVHLAGQPGVRLSWGSDFVAYTRDNIDATQRLLEVARDAPSLVRFLNASSSSIYGQAESFPTSELSLPQPFSPYGVTKLAAEHLGSLYKANHGVPVSSFRFFTVYGPKQRPDMAFDRFLRAAARRRALTIYGDGTQIRDFTYVGDICNALILALDQEGNLPAVMNLSGGSSVSVNDVLATIESVTGIPINVQYVSSVRGDVSRTGGDTTLASTTLGWVPSTSLEAGLQRQWARISDDH
jgi:UDP-glucuronate 4-epimerase